jgi:hypothetical protein
VKEAEAKVGDEGDVGLGGGLVTVGVADGSFVAVGCGVSVACAVGVGEWTGAKVGLKVN